MSPEVLAALKRAVLVLRDENRGFAFDLLTFITREGCGCVAACAALADGVDPSVRLYYMDGLELNVYGLLSKTILQGKGPWLDERGLLRDEWKRGERAANLFADWIESL